VRRLTHSRAADTDDALGPAAADPVRRADTVTGEVAIRRPVQDVYRFYRDFANLPRCLGDVVAVEQVADRRYRWTVAGPLGTRMPVTVTVTEQQVDHLIRYETSGPALLRGRWKLAFAPDTDAGGTRLREQLVVPLGAIGRVLLAIIGKFPDREVAANLARLKQLLETGDGNGTASGPSSRCVRPFGGTVRPRTGDA
jgi:uncharacterized membrane protein